MACYESMESYAGQSYYQQSRSSSPTGLCSIDLKSDAIYKLSMDASSREGNWQVIVIDEASGTLIQQVLLDRVRGAQRVEGLFKTMSGGRIKLALQHFGRDKDDALHISRISVSEVKEWH